MLALLLACRTTGLPTTQIQVAGHALTVEVADDPTERAQGLMYRKELGDDAGMLFVYPDERPRSFWMKNTPLPLSIAYLDASGKVVSLADMTPMSTESVPSAGPAQYALEVNRGWYAAHGVEPGALVQGLPGAASE